MSTLLRLAVPLAVALLGCSASAPADEVDTPSTSSAELIAAPEGPAAATLRFTCEAWPASVEGTVIAGAPLRIAYDPARLPECRQLNRNTAWEVVMHYRFDDGPVAALVVADPGMALARDVIDVPAGARTLTLWFENFAAANGGRDIVCQTWDSVYGRNYVFAVH